MYVLANIRNGSKSAKQLKVYICNQPFILAYSLKEKLFGQHIPILERLDVIYSFTFAT
jgi:hypothetical protein